MQSQKSIVFLLVTLGLSLAANAARAQVSSPRGFVRSDSVNTVVYTGVAPDFSQHIYELRLTPTGMWKLSDLNVTRAYVTPSAATGPAPYVRTAFDCCLDTNSIVYVSEDGQIQDISRTPPPSGIRQDSNLTLLTGAPPAVTTASPSAISRFDVGGNPIWSVTYKAQTNGHIYELTNGPYFSNGWQMDDISVQSGAPTAVGTPNTASVWSGKQDIFYRGLNGKIIHLQKSYNTPWVVENLTTLTNAPLTTTDAMAITHRADNYTSVVYRGSDGQIYELYQNLISDPAWHVGGPGNLANAPTANSTPYAYVRHDDTYSILYTAENGHIIELHLTNAWHYHDLTALAGAPIAAVSGRPSAYRRADGVNSVVYRGTNSHMIEIYNFSGTTTWHWGDLTTLAQ
jgi:hypothetical protein